LAPRVAALIPPILLLFSACLKAPAAGQREGGCRACHPPHYVREATCEGCHRGDPAAARQQLAHARLLTGRAAEHRLANGLAMRDGKQLVEALACRRCHRIAGEGNRLAADLDAVVWRRSQQELATSILVPVENMPTFGLDRLQVEAVIAFLLRSGNAGQVQDTYRVRFARRAGRDSRVFDTRCGGCHSALGPLGPMGTGSQGPNLSGLFTPFYPATAPGNRPWSPEALAEWLRNPRASRPGTTMPPVQLKDDELRDVASQLGGLEKET
jgi:cytochrome c2